MAGRCPKLSGLLLKENTCGTNSFMSGDDETRTRDLCRDSGPVIGFTTYKIARTAKGPPKLFKIAQDTALCGLRIQPFSTIDIRRHAGKYSKNELSPYFARKCFNY